MKILLDFLVLGEKFLSLSFLRLSFSFFRLEYFYLRPKNPVLSKTIILFQYTGLASLGTDTTVSQKKVHANEFVLIFFSFSHPYSYMQK